MEFYSDVQKIASDVLNEFGQGTVRYIAVTPGNGPADNPGAPQETSHSVKAAVRGAKFKYVTTGLAQASDLQVTMAVSAAFTPNDKGFVEIDGKRYKIVQIMPKPAAGTPVLYTLIVRT